MKRWNLVCGNMENFPRYVQLVFFLGSMVGTLMIGPFCDWFGRKTGYLTCMTLWSATSIIGYFLDNPYAWLFTRFINGRDLSALKTSLVIPLIMFQVH